MTWEVMAAENAELQRRLAEAEETLRAIRDGAVDAFVVEGSNGSRVYTLEGADLPYRLLVEQMQQGAATLNAEGLIAYCNLSLAELLKVPHERLIGQPLRSFVAPASVSLYGKLLQEGYLRASQSEIQVQRADGSLVPAYFTFGALTEESGATLCVLITDLTAQKHQAELAAAYRSLKQSEVALRESEAQLETELADTKLLQEISSALIFDENIQGLYQKIVQAAVRIMSSDFASLHMFLPGRGKEGELYLLASHGFDRHSAREWVSWDSTCSAGMALRSRERAILPAFKHCSELAGAVDLDSYLKSGIKAAQSTPLVSRSGSVVGMISTHWKAPYTPTERELRMLDLLARQAADFIDRTQTERALRRAVEFDEAVMSNMGEGLYTVDTAGQVTFMNPAAEQMFGWTLEELRGKKMHDVTHYKHRDGSPFPAAECAGFRVLKDGQTVTHHEDLFIKKDGTFFDVVYSSSPIREAGVITGLVVVFRDVTEKKRAAEVLRQRTAQYETLLKEAPLGVYVVDSAFRIRDLNPTARPYFGELQDLEGRDFAELVRILRPQDATKIIAIFRNTLETGGPYVTTERIDNRVKSGETEYFAWQINRIPLPDGTRGVVCYFQDISLMMQARQAIAESEERYRTLVSVLTDVPWTTDPQGQFVSPQPAWTAYTGQTWEECRGFGWANALHPADRDRVRVIWEEARRMRTLYRSQGRIWHARSQAYRYFEARATPLLDSDGAVRQWVGSCTDVDERRRAETELRRANADLEQFAYSASHDLQEPIRNISVYGEIMGKRYAHALDARGKQYLSFITDGAKRMEALVKDLLAYTQSTSIDREGAGKASATDALNRALANLSEAIRESRAEILHNGLPTLPVREVQLEQLFQNLVGNAIKYRREMEPPRIRIKAEREGEYWKFSVQDNGIGISPEFKEKVFGLFKRLHNDAAYAGTGIGLAICQKIVDQNGGRIWVTSDGPGTGSTFLFTLPA